MKRIFLFMLILILSALMTACGDGATKKLVKQLNSSYDYDGKEVTLTGYPIFNRGGAITINGKTSIDLSNSNWSQKPFAQVKINFSKGPNSVWMPDKFRPEDVEFYDSNGQKHTGLNTKLTLKGIVHYTKKDWKEKLSQKPGGMLSGAFTAMNSDNDAKKLADDREKKTGDPNDYSFEIIVNEISVAK